MVTAPVPRVYGLDAICAAALQAGGEDSAQFARRLFGRLSDKDLAAAPVDQRAAAATSLLAFARRRLPGVAKVRIFNPSLADHGFESRHTIVQIVNDDMPFLVDSIANEFNRREFAVHLLAHPVMAARRDLDGDLVGIALEASERARSESMMHIEIDRQADPGLLDEIAAALTRELAEVRLAVDDWQAMRRACLDAIADLAPGQGEALAPDASRDAGPLDPAYLIYTSGSTGRPKGTVHSHGNPYWTCELYAKGILKLREDDVCFSAAKLFFAYGLGNALTFPMSVGATTILMGERPTPDATFKRWLGHVGGMKPTVFFGAPTGFAGMLANPNLPARGDVAMRLVSSAGEALPADLGQRFQAHFGVDIVDGIGSTEMLHIFLSNTPERVRYGTTGWPVPGYDIELRGDDGNPVPDGEPGDLYIHGPSAAMMYWGNRTKTRETFQGGWTKSGDKYSRNEDGSYTYGGRSDDMLKVSGIYVSPFEVEATLVQHAAVLEAAVIGVPDGEGLTKTKAFVVLKDGAVATADELKAFVKDKLAPYKYPRQIEFVQELPKTATGKIQRFKLRDQETNGA